MKRILAFVLVVVLVVSMVLPSCTKSTSAYKVATDATWAPFETVNEKTKQIEGFDIDLFNAIAVFMSMPNRLTTRFRLLRLPPAGNTASAWVIPSASRKAILMITAHLSLTGGVTATKRITAHG
jgi:hypothetical protein